MKLFLLLLIAALFVSYAFATDDAIDEPIIKTTTHSGVVTSTKGDFDAVTGFVLTCDEKAFIESRHQAPVHHGARVNDDGHSQPFADILYTSFRAHGRDYRFQMHLNRNIMGENLHHEFMDAAGVITKRRAVARAYIGVNDGGDEAERIHATLGDDGTLHATIVVGQTLFTVDIVDRHAEALEHRLDEVTTAAGAHRMVIKRETADTLESVLLNHSEVFGDPINSPLRKLLAKGFGKNKRRAPQRWTGCYHGEDKGLAFNMGIALDTAFYNRKCDTNDAKCDRIITELINDMNTIFIPQLNVYLKVSHTFIVKGAPSASVAPFVHSWNRTDRGRRRCRGSTNDHIKAIKAFGKWRSAASGSARGNSGLWHLFSDCKYDKNVLGAAYVGYICKDNRINVAITSTSRGSKSFWMTGAHETGHQMGANHSFEKGQGKTGGIMDYGDGRFKGLYQFNTQYRKKEICAKITKTLPGGPFKFGLVSKCWDVVKETPAPADKVLDVW